VTGNVAGLLASRIVMGVAGLVTLPVLYVYLGSERFGIWALLTGMAVVFTLVDLGLGSAIVREVAATVHDGQPRRTRAVLGIALSWQITLPLIVTPALVAAWPLLAELLNLGTHLVQARGAVLWLMAGVLLDGVAMPWRGVLEGTQHYVALSWLTAATAVLGAGLLMATVRLGGGLAALAASVAATSATRTCWTIVAARRYAPGLSPSLRGVNRDDLRSVTSYGTRVQVTAVSGVVNLELDRFILSGFFGPGIASGFELGGRLVNLLRVPPAFALVALFPMAVSRTAQRGTAWLEQFNVHITRYLTMFTATGAAVLVVCADPVVRLWLGEPNSWAAANIAILAPAYAVNLMSGATAVLTRVEGRPGRETSYAVASMLINLGLTWPLLRILGPVGVPVATAVGVILSTVYFLTSYHRMADRPIAPLVRAIWPPLLAAIAAAAGGALAVPVLPDGPGRWEAGLAVLCRGSVVVFLAFGALVALGAFGGDDRERLGRLSTMVGGRS
jgi:O-antigen/teichoic acid export membrane protein